VLDLRDVLSEDERERADRFHFARDRRRFTVARGVLRRLLGRYLGAPAAGVRFAYGAQGKPRLDHTELHFNVSHAGVFALYAFTVGRDIGVDIEQIRPMEDMLQIARRFFSASEVRTLESLAAEVQPLAFYNCWTRKEAYIKARGEGLALALDAFDVTLRPGDAARMLRADDSREVERWSLHAIDAAPGYAAALAVEGHASPMRCWRWLA
jgi:4'-phosphopantetheinyl transferase